MKIVIIGGMGVGSRTALQAKKVNPNDEVIVYEKTDIVGLGSCGLPYFIAGINTYEQMEVRSKDTMISQGIIVKDNTEVISIDQKAKTITSVNEGNEATESYDKLIIASGATSRTLDFEMIGTPKDIFNLKTFADGKALKERLGDNKEVLIVGTGFIGAEAAEALSLHGNTKVNIIGINEQFLRLDKEFSDMVKKGFEEHGVIVHQNDSIAKVNNETNVATLKSGKELSFDAIIISIGQYQNNPLVKALDLKWENNQIWHTDEYQTSDKDIFVVGDASSARNVITDSKVSYGTAYPATIGSMIAIDAINERESHLGPVKVTQSQVIKFYDDSVAMIGIDKATAERNGIEAAEISIVAENHTSFYPNQRPITIKTLYDVKTHKILGAQLFGESSDKRGDVLATMIYAGLKMEDLAKIQLNYSPPYSRGLDAINIIGINFINKVLRK